MDTFSRPCFSVLYSNNINKALSYTRRSKTSSASCIFFVPQTCILSSITAKNQIHWSKVQSFTILGSPARRVAASHKCKVESANSAKFLKFPRCARLFLKESIKIHQGILKNFPRCARKIIFHHPQNMWKVESATFPDFRISEFGPSRTSMH